MKAWWQLYQQAFSPEECQALTDYALSKPGRDGQIGHGGRLEVNPVMRRSTVRWLHADDERLIGFFFRVQRMAEQANKAAFGFDLHGLPDAMQFGEYNSENSGHYDWHMDNNFKSSQPLDRKLSMVLQLSDPASYTGGKLELQHDPLPDNRFINQGDVIFFPAFNRHRVTPVTSGVRYSLVAWFMGPHFK